MLKMFLLQLKFLTTIPLPVKIEFDENKFAKGVIFSPVVGLIIGLILGGTFILVNLAGKQIIAVVSVVFVGIIITGGLHLDGLADTFDGIFSNQPKEKILKIMKDSRIGTNGTLALIMDVIFRISLLYSLSEQNMFAYLCITPVISRMSIAWTAGLASGTRKGSMAGALVKHTGYREIIIASAITAFLSIAFIRQLTLVVIPAVILFAVICERYAEKKIGCISGDIIGAVIEMTEITVLFALFIYELF
ncbi:MAG: adenosylcobinamide-GDP ribazoletransferase [Spirochaetota bacterium]